jgi:hypothetical protein
MLSSHLGNAIANAAVNGLPSERNRLLRPLRTLARMRGQVRTDALTRAGGKLDASL